MIAAGLSTVDHKKEAARIFSCLFDAGTAFGDNRLPELFCGFDRERSAPPVSYPVSCVPQAWASGSLFQLIEACLGIDVDGAQGELKIKGAYLPTFINTINIKALPIGLGKTDFGLKRTENGYSLNGFHTYGKVNFHMEGTSKTSP